MAKSPHRRAPSIRGRLLGYLLLPLVLLLVASIWVDHRSFVTPIYDAFDRALSRAAVAIAAHLERGDDGQIYLEKPDFGPGPIPPPPEREAGEHDRPPPHFEAGERPTVWTRLFPGARDSFLFRVCLPDGHTMAGDAGLPITQVDAAEGFRYRDVTYKQLTRQLLVGDVAVAEALGGVDLGDRQARIAGHGMSVRQAYAKQEAVPRPRKQPRPYRRPLAGFEMRWWTVMLAGLALGRWRYGTRAEIGLFQIDLAVVATLQMRRNGDRGTRERAIERVVDRRDEAAVIHPYAGHQQQHQRQQ